MMVCCRSHGEIQELIDRQLEEITGDDHREWPDIITIEEEVRQ